MEKEKKDFLQEKISHIAPVGSSTRLQFKPKSGAKFAYQALAQWIILRKKERAVAEMFFMAYLKDVKKIGRRPITFVFNGGPGAASAYLHLGSMGPKRVHFNDEGTPAKPPAQLVDNYESWLPFTDLVFIDPIGTGFSRVIPEREIKNTNDDSDGQDKADKKTRKKEKEFY